MKFVLKDQEIQTPIVIIGMGKSGDSALLLLQDLKISRSEILTFDHKLTTANTQNIEDVLAFKPKTLVISPGVPLASPWIKSLVQQGVFITSELSLACRTLTSEKIIGITGSVGKSTTTAALGAAALAVDPNSFVGGNLGIPLSQYAHEVATKERPRAKYIALELSSFHLENCEGLELDAAIITFLSANHLERYRNLEHYYETKFKIAKHTKGPLVLNENGGDLSSVFLNYLCPKTTQAWASPKTVNPAIFDLDKAALLGIHNKDNLSLAYEIIKLQAWGPSAYQALLEFTGLDHRLQKIGEYKNILFVNDSKATALDSVLIATESCLRLKRNGTLHLLLGGRDKSLPWQNLKVLQKNKSLKFYFFGECRKIAQVGSQLIGEQYSNLSLALEQVLINAQSGDTVLLSPGGTSMDEFKNFEERGNFFVQRVMQFSK